MVFVGKFWRNGAMARKRRRSGLQGHLPNRRKSMRYFVGVGLEEEQDEVKKRVEALVAKEIGQRAPAARWQLLRVRHQIDTDVTDSLLEL